MVDTCKADDADSGAPTRMISGSSLPVAEFGSCSARETNENSIVEKFAMHSTVEAVREKERETVATGL
jgi:hypothetical protein